MVIAGISRLSSESVARGQIVSRTGWSLEEDCSVSGCKRDVIMAPMIARTVPLSLAERTLDARESCAQKGIGGSSANAFSTTTSVQKPDGTRSRNGKRVGINRPPIQQSPGTVA